MHVEHLLFLMCVWVGISIWCVLKLSEWKESFWGNFWGPPNLSSSCDNNHTCQTNVLQKHHFWRVYMMKIPLKIDAKSKKNCMRRWRPAVLRGPCIYSWRAHCLPDFCQKGWTGDWQCCGRSCWLGGVSHWLGRASNTVTVTLDIDRMLLHKFLY